METIAAAVQLLSNIGFGVPRFDRSYGKPQVFTHSSKFFCIEIAKNAHAANCRKVPLTGPTDGSKNAPFWHDHKTPRLKLP
jgi:hypothetical protein